jgi:hypothetical protein
MASNLAEISVTELDFDLIKGKLIEYFKADPTFQDYNFEGSALNIILDILSNNTHMNAIMANMAANEMFIDSAQLRSSIVSIAKSVGYTPRSKRTAVAVVNITFTDIPDFPLYINMPAGTRFITPQGIVFSTKEQLLVYPKMNGAIGEYYIEDVEIYEGFYTTFRYIVDPSDSQKFVIPSTDADMTSLIVKNIAGSTVNEFTKNENITLNTRTSNVYYLHENLNGEYEVTFGDNVIGRKPTVGSTIELSYIISRHGEEANNLSVFQKNQLIDGHNTFTIETKVVAYGAASRESKKSVQNIAPKMYKAQSRAVTTDDYENFLLTEYPWIDSMSIWGGEYNEPPTYGKVFIAIKPSHTDILSSSLKERIKNNLIKKYNVVTVIPEILDPDYIYVLVDTKVQYAIGTTTRTRGQINTLINEGIVNYFQENTQLFNKPLYFSKLTTAIDSSEQSISNSITSLKMMKNFSPKVGVLEAREIKFNNPIVPGTLRSSYYNIAGSVGEIAKQQVLDDGKGTLYTRNVLTNEIVFSDIGKIDYLTGKMGLSFIIYNLPIDTEDVRLYCTPAVSNISPGFNQIVLLDRSPVNLDFGRPAGVSVSVTAENRDYK